MRVTEDIFLDLGDLMGTTAKVYADIENGRAKITLIEAKLKIGPKNEELSVDVTSLVRPLILMGLRKTIEGPYKDLNLVAPWDDGSPGIA